MKEQRSLQISLRTHFLSSIFPCQHCSHHYFTGSPQEIKCTRGSALPGWWEWPCGGQPGLFCWQDLMDHTNPSPFSLSGPHSSSFSLKEMSILTELRQQEESQVQVLVSKLKEPISISPETFAAARSGWALTQTRCLLSSTFNIRERCCPQIKVTRNPPPNITIN